MSNRGGQLAECRDAGHMGELGLRLAQRLFGLIGPDARGHVGADATVAEKIAIGGEQRFAAGPDINRMSVAVFAAVNQVAERNVGVECRPMFSPLFRLKTSVWRNVPACQPEDRRVGCAGRVAMLGDVADAMVRSRFPEPIGGGLGIVAKPLLAFPESSFG